MQAWGSRRPDPELSRLQPWDTSKPLVINDALSSAAVPSNPVKYGIGGDPIELHQNLYACLRVGRIDRATAIVQRLTDMYDPSAPEVVDAHNVFLQTMFDLAQQKHLEEFKGMADIENWYNAKMVRNGIEPNAKTYVTLLRAAMNFLKGGEQETAIRKYLALAHESGPGVLDDVNASPEFSDEEWDTLIRFQPDTFEEPPSVDEVQDFQDLQISTPAGQALAIQHGLIPDHSLSVKSVPQKGLGLSSLKKSLAVFEPGEGVPYPHELEGTEEEKDRAYAYMRQIRLEEDGLRAATERWKAEDSKLQEIGIHGVLQSKPIQALMWNWHIALKDRIEKEIEVIKDVLSNPNPDNMRDDRHIYGPYLEDCPPEKLAALTVMKILSACAGGSREDNQALKFTQLALQLGKDAEEEYNSSAKARYDAFLKKTRAQARRNLLNKLSKDQATFDVKKSSSSMVNVASDAFKKKDYPLHVRAKIGALLLDNFIQSAKITVTREDPKTGKQLTSTQPAFHHHTGFQNGKRIIWIGPHFEVFEKLRTDPVHNVSAMKMPMLVEPKPWLSFYEGGYYSMRDQAVRTKVGDSSQKAYAISAIENGDMKKVLAGLDTLGRVPWNINQEVFRVMLEAWNRDENIGGLVPGDAGLQRPTEPPADAPYQVRRTYEATLREYENTKSGLHSQRCFQNFQLEVARAFLKEKFYYPHSVDFRGRAYPVPPILNHIGADMARGLLKFANGKELGAVGLQWLKVHLANLYGYDKSSLKDREQFAMDNIDQIYDSATNPLGGNRWWIKAEDPWQCLACCIELKNALESPDPTRFVSQLPVHQDGTCNGLQHYAALGGDEAGASQVNLEPSDRPQDIYTGVAELVREMVAKDAKNGIMNATFMDGKISRRVVKRTVMTNVYGVTFMGAKLQVLDELKEIFPNFQPQEGIPNLVMPAMYIAKKIFLALGKIFNGAQEIQYWLGECGERITTSLSTDQIQKISQRFDGKQLGFDAKYKQTKQISDRVQKKLDKDIENFKSSIIWTTPLKMPVVQPYRKDTLQRVKTSIASISFAKQAATDVIDKRKQLQAFPPNFIHSLDATHMILSALKCSELGLDFAAVHDSFWTHAADIPNLNVVLRDAFVRMHSEDIIGRLAAEFTARYAGSMYLANLVPTSAVAQEIMEWRMVRKKATSKGTEANYEEVALEAKRQELLKSENEEQRLEGEQIVTPTSIWLKYQDPLSLASFRLALLGDTKSKSGKTLDKMKEKVLGTEVDVAKADSDSAHVEAASLEADVTAEDLAEADVEVDAPGVDKIRRSKAGNPQHKGGLVKVWLPLTFPDVPKKGSWDVRRLRESRYFFS